MAIFVYFVASFLLVFAVPLFLIGVTQLGTEGAGDLVGAAATLAAASLATLAATQASVTWREQRARQIIESQSVKRRDVYEMLLTEMVKQFLPKEESRPLSEVRAAVAVWASPELIKALSGWYKMTQEFKDKILEDTERAVVWAAFYRVYAIVRHELAPAKDRVTQDEAIGLIFDDYYATMAKLAKSGA